MKTAKEVDQTLAFAGKIASKYGHQYLSTEHFLLAILKNKEFANYMLEFGVQLEELQLDIESHLVEAFASVDGTGQIKTQSLERVFNRAMTSVLFSGRETLTLLDLFISITSEQNSHSSYFLMKYNVSKEEFMRFMKTNNKHRQLSQKHEQYLDGIVNE